MSEESEAKTPSVLQEQQTAQERRKGPIKWRGAKPAGFILHPEGFMRECLEMDVSLRTMDGVIWVGVLKEVTEEGDVVIRPAQEMLFGEKDGPELPEKKLFKHNIIWLRRHPKDTDILIGVPGRGPPAPERRYEPGTEPQPDEEGEAGKGAAASADEP